MITDLYWRSWWTGEGDEGVLWGGVGRSWEVSDEVEGRPEEGLFGELL